VIKVCLVEDEPPALRKLERLVATQSDLSICGTAATCAEAISGITRTTPHLVILDVRLPDGTGIEVLQALEEPRDLHVIFVTAYENYAVEAFEAAALDYLLKPVAQERFARAIQRVRDHLATPATQGKAEYARRFLVEKSKSAYFLPVESIHRIAAERNYALLYSAMGEFTLRTTMAALEQRLDPRDFARVNRSTIVRVEAIREVRTRDERGYVIVLVSGEEIVCSKRYWTAALDRLL
jgi:two-component system, LytTR family, response regulator